ncbi:MAG: DUF3159 domain-containing protein [Mycobacteriales bacterium]|nr:DUF3159 domain-containing protein [Mycobacteriales bacterium]
MPEDRTAPPAPTTSTFAEAIGGTRGVIDSALPATAFVLTRLATDSLNTAIVVALVVGVGLLALRTRRGEPLTQVWSGFFGLVIAVLFARATGTGEGFFIPGIIMTGLTGVGFTVSLLVGRPAVGLVLAAFDEKYAGWRDHPGLFRACQLATAVWTVTFFIRAGVAETVRRGEGDNDGQLFLVINVVKYACIAVAAVVSVVLVRRSGFTAPQPAVDDDALVEPAAEPDPH